VVSRLYRAISLYKDTAHVTEELFVKGKCEEARPEVEDVHLGFKARYFTYMDLGLDIDLGAFTRIWDWFAMGFHSLPFQGYGFATNAHIGPVANPHPDLVDSANAHKTFSWVLEEASRAFCVHSFDRCDRKQLESRTGKAWYEHIYRPLYAQID
jgi:hypothetical protein